jgi:hypothetical protein
MLETALDIAAKLYDPLMHHEWRREVGPSTSTSIDS